MFARNAAKAFALLPLLFAVTQPAQAAKTETAIFAGGLRIPEHPATDSRVSGHPLFGGSYY